MNTHLSQLFHPLAALQWLARLLGLASVALLALFIFGEGFNPLRMTRGELVLSLFFPLGVIAGLALAWWKEGVGGTLCVGSLLAFYAAHYLIAGDFPRGWAFLVFALPGFLFLTHWLLARQSAH
jgi:hypothetical protein